MLQSSTQFIIVGIPKKFDNKNEAILSGIAFKLGLEYQKRGVLDDLGKSLPDQKSIDEIIDLLKLLKKEV